MRYELHRESLFTRSRYPQFHRCARFPRFPFLSALSGRTWSQQKRREERKVPSLSLSLYLAYFFASIARCISRVVECKLLRAWGWFTANWFVNVVFTPLETPIFLPFLSAVLASVRGEKLQGSVVTWPSLLASSSRIKRLQVGFGWPISYKIASPFRFGYPPSSRCLFFFFFSLSEWRQNLLLGEKETREREYIKSLEFV